MRPTQFSADTILALLRKETVVSLPDVLVALGPRVSRRTAFRKLKDLDARTSYSHRGGYYTLDELADFDERGFWSFAGIRFSPRRHPRRNRRGVRQARRGRTFVDELDNLLHVGTQDALLRLAGDGRLTRHKLAGQFLYCAPDPAQQTHQLRARRLRGRPGRRRLHAGCATSSRRVGWGVRGHVTQRRPQTRGLFGCGGIELRPFPTHTCFRVFRRICG